MVSMKALLSGAVLVGASVFITAQVVTAEPAKSARDLTKDAKQAVKDAVPTMENSAEMAEMMQKMAAYGTPGAEHKNLATWEGKWNLKVTHWMAENAPPMESPATAECKTIFGGRYVQEKVSGNMMGQPFEGMALMGYNNGTKEYFSFWIDNMSTGYMVENGTMNAEGNMLASKGDMYCPIREKNCSSASKISIIDNNTRKMEMFAPDMKTNNMYKCMEIIYTRAN